MDADHDASDAPVVVHRVAIDDVLKFCFPANILHPRSTTRLYALAEYGPLYREHSFATCVCLDCQHRARQHRASMKSADAALLTSIMFDRRALAEGDLERLPFLCATCTTHIRSIVHLKSGHKGAHVVSDSELERMCALEERRDLVSVFMPPEYLSALERDAFLRTLDRRMQAVPNLRRDDVLAMLAPLADPDRSIEFHALSRAVRAHRAAIVRQFANPNYIVRQAAKEHRIRLARRCPVMTVADRTLPDDLPPYERLAKLLHRHAFQITPSRAASSSANVNVRILLDRPSDSTTGWDGNFGLAVRHD